MYDREQMRVYQADRRARIRREERDDIIKRLEELEKSRDELWESMSGITRYLKGVGFDDGK